MNAEEKRDRIKTLICISAISMIIGLSIGTIVIALIDNDDIIIENSVNEALFLFTKIKIVIYAMYIIVMESVNNFYPIVKTTKEVDEDEENKL